MTTKSIRVISILDEFWFGNPHGGERREDTISIECSDCSDASGSMTLTLPLWRDMHEQYGYTPDRVIIDGHTYPMLNARSTYYYEDTPFAINVGADLCKDPSPVIEVYYKRWGGGFYNCVVMLGWAFSLPPLNLFDPNFRIENYVQVSVDGVLAMTGAVTTFSKKVRRGGSAVIKVTGKVIKNQRFGFAGGPAKRIDSYSDSGSELRVEQIEGNVMVTIPMEMW